MVTTLLIVIIALLIITPFAITFFLRKKSPTSNGELVLLQGQLNEITRTLDSKLGESTRAMQMQFGQSAKIIENVTERLTKLDETNRQVVNFAEQLQALQDILKNPKQRGVLGEYYLETLLKNVLPPGNYEMQYHLGLDENTGKELIPDAVVFVKDKIIPVDSKFSLENYNRLVEEKNDVERARLEKLFVNDLKQRITETAKYIKPEKGTLDFAFMFIPHEAIYYDLLINKIGGGEEGENLIQRAAQKYHVVIVSPTSFLAYLQTVLQGLHALKIEEGVKEIVKNVGNLGTHLKKYEEFMKKIGKHLGTTVHAYNDAYKEFGKIDKDTLRITGEGIGVEKDILETPQPTDD